MRPPTPRALEHLFPEISELLHRLFVKPQSSRTRIFLR